MHIAFRERLPQVGSFYRVMPTQSLHYPQTPVAVCLESRERVSGSDDLGSPPSELAAKYPHLDFSRTVSLSFPLCFSFVELNIARNRKGRLLWWVTVWQI